MNPLIFKVPFLTKFLDGKSKVQIDLHIDIVKAFLIVSFLGTMMPSGKITIPNAYFLLIIILESIDSIFRFDLGLRLLDSLIMGLVASVGIILIFFQKKWFNLLGIFMQYIWLGYLLSFSTWKVIKDLALLITVLIYLLMTFILFVYLSHKSDLNFKK